MKLRQLTLAWLMALTLTAYAANTKTTVEQVTSAVQLTADVDYIVTSTTPFTTAGSVDIQSTEHAVLIFSNIKPSKVLSNWMNYIYINGVKAVDGTNCQVKMYGRGAIVFPYGADFQPLTCYTEKNYGGESCSNYSEGHENGFMKTLTTAQLNNQIRSFKLKRGYMVTFAIGTSGWGYSRCFIADQEDLEIATLPSILDKKISSYRLFKWHNAHKAGLANNTDQGANQAVNSSWCYDWGEGNATKEPDVEWVVNHIYEDWPPIATCGRVTQTSHMKNNNEPRNPSDDHPQDLETILNNWPNIMRTGMRLCSPSSWDSSDFWNGTGFIKTFLDSIDARGWRCDIVDAHAYWESTGQFNNLANYWYPNMHRPIWVSEWIWGSCWSGNQKGFWTRVSNPDDTSEATQQILYDGTKPILDILNAAQCVERYAYWNSWSNGSKIYHNGSLTKLGEYYATMDVPQGYNPDVQFIPKNPPLKPIGEVTVNYDKATKTVKLSWIDPNGELMESYTIRRKQLKEDLFRDIKTVARRDGVYPSGSVSFVNVSVDTLDESGFYTYKIKAVAHDGTVFETNSVNVEADPAQGIADFQYGNLNMDTPDTKSINYTESFRSPNQRKHAVFMGIPSNQSSSFYASTQVTNATQPRLFSIALVPWTTSGADITESIELPFLALNYGNHTFGDMDCEVNYVTSNAASTNLWTDPTTVTFTKPFPEGVTPIVLTEVRNTTTANALSVRVFDVTNTGFKFIIYPEGATKKLSSETINYMAITPGFATVNEENGILIAAGHGTDNNIYSSSLRENKFKLDVKDETEGTTTPEQLYFHSPVILGALQTNNYPTACMLRRTNSTTRIDGVLWTTGIKVKRLLDHAITVNGSEISVRTSDAAYQDKLGWVVVANSREGGSIPTAIEAVSTDKSADGTLEPRIVNGRVFLDGTSNFDLYQLTGAKISSESTLSPGIYVIKANGKSAKFLVK